MKKENYFTIQGWMIEDLGLKSNQLLVYAVIHGFSQDGESEYKGGTGYLCNTLKLSKPTVIKILNELVSDGVIDKRVEVISQMKFNRFKTLLGVKKLNQGGKETLQVGGKETLPSINTIKGNKKRNNIYRNFKHLSITHNQYEELNKIYSKEEIDDILDRIENYRKNTNYNSLSKTALNWLKKQYPNRVERGGRNVSWSIGDDPMIFSGSLREFNDVKDQYDQMGVKVYLKE